MSHDRSNGGINIFDDVLAESLSFSQSLQTWRKARESREIERQYNCCATIQRAVLTRVEGEGREAAVDRECDRRESTDSS